MNERETIPKKMPLSIIPVTKYLNLKINILPLEVNRQEGPKFQTSLGYTATSRQTWDTWNCLKTIIEKGYL